MRLKYPIHGPGVGKSHCAALTDFFVGNGRSDLVHLYSVPGRAERRIKSAGLKPCSFRCPFAFSFFSYFSLPFPCLLLPFHCILSLSRGSTPRQSHGGWDQLLTPAACPGVAQKTKGFWSTPCVENHYSEYTARILIRRHTGIVFLRREVAVWFPANQGCARMEHCPTQSHFQPWRLAQWFYGSFLIFLLF